MDFEPRCDDGSMPTDCALKRWYGDLKAATRKAERPIQYSTMSTNMLAEAGFEDVHEQIIQVPVNRWPRDHFREYVGIWYGLWMDEEALLGLSMQPFTHVLHKSPDEVRSAVRAAAEDMRRNRYHTFNEL